jgi:hypothetical protein
MSMIVNEICGVTIPDSQVAREATQFIRDTESDLLFAHSTRVYFWGALAGKRKGLTFDPELLYTATMFHDVGLTSGFRESRLRFEVDGANAARDFLRSHGISESDIKKVWLAIALHTTPGISAHLHPVAALTAEGVMMDLTALAMTNSPTRSGRRWRRPIPVRRNSRRTFSRRFTTASSTGRKRPKPPDSPISWPTRTPIFTAVTFAA